MTVVLLVLLAGAVGTIAASERLPLGRVAPATAAGLLFLALLMRALLAVGLGVIVFLRLAELSVVQAALNWCWHDLLPDLPGLLGFAEHPATHAIVATPLALLAASVAWLALRQVAAWLALRGRLAHALGEGPLGSTVVAGDDLLLAVTRVGRSRILVSARALRELDEAELAAGLAHELGHIRRRHRVVLLGASLLGSLARPLPGTGAAERLLAFHLERDADEYAVRRIGDPLSLASAICKSAAAGGSQRFLVTLGGSGATLRVRELLEGALPRSRAAERGARFLALALIGFTFVLTIAASSWALSPASPAPAAAHPCDHR